MQIIVVGMHRSGTSALTRVLGLMGCWLGEPDDLNPVQPDNPKGYWERRDVWTLNEAMLESLGATWCRVADLTLDRWPQETRADFEGQAGAIVQAMDTHDNWAVKDPRMCLLMPVWQAVLTRPVFVFMVRRPLQVARSLQTRDGFPLAVGAALWEKHMLAALRHTAGFPRLVVHHQQLMGDPMTTAADLLAGLESFGVRGLHVPETEALRDFVDPALFRSHGAGEEEASLLNPVQHELWRAVSDGSALRRGSWPALSTGCDDLLRSWSDQIARSERAEAEAGRLDARLADKEEQVTDLAQHLQTANDQLRELSEELRASLRRAEDLTGRARSAERRAADAVVLRSHVERAANLFDQQQALLDLVLQSRRFRLAELVGETARKLTLRPGQPAAAEHAARILADYETWRRELAGGRGPAPAESGEADR